MRTPQQHPIILHLGDMREVLAGLEEASIDAVVCDPPYELAFMGKRWDASGVSFDPETWRACLRVLKPGGHLLAFGGTRTVHRIAVAIEDAGFAIRDQIVWMYGSGFPKSHNIGAGFGTALKPAHEPIIVARKPLVGTVAANVTAHGTGALNIDGCRIGSDGGCRTDAPYAGGKRGAVYNVGLNEQRSPCVDGLGRWPANVCLDETAAEMLDAQSGASRFFYVAKASRAERNAGLDGMAEKPIAYSNGAKSAVAAGLETYGESGSIGFDKIKHAQNNHPTVKPVALMRWLVRLVTPPGGVVCDPFLGSGTTGIAAVLEGMGFVGIEQSAEYLEIARRRIAHAQGPLFAQVAD
jgi:DNA modification methylase